MAELTIDPASIRKALDDFVSSYKPSDTPTQEVGYVATAGDGIAHVTGLPGCMANELLTFEDGTLGLAFNLDAREIGVVILGDFAGIEEGQEVRRTGEVLSVSWTRWASRSTASARSRALRVVVSSKPRPPT